jgi:hypothetical protein
LGKRQFFRRKIAKNRRKLPIIVIVTLNPGYIVTLTAIFRNENSLLFPTVRPLIWATSIDDMEATDDVEFFRRSPANAKKTSENFFFFFWD